MPVAIPALAAAFANAAFATASAVGLSAATAGAVASGVMGATLSLGGALGIGSAISSWGTVMAIGSVAGSMAMKAPKPQSSGIQLDNQMDPNAPTPICFGRTATGGAVRYQTTHQKKNELLSRIVVLSSGPIDGFESCFANDYALTFNVDPTTGLAECVATSAGPASKLFVSNVRQAYRFGLTPEDVAPPIYSGTAMPDLDAMSKLSGLAHVTQHLHYGVEAFATSLPKFLWVIRGVRCYDPRADGTYPGGLGSQRLSNPSTWTYTENPYLHALAWTLGRYEGPTAEKVWGIGADWDEIDVPAFVAGANLADANSWKCGGVVTTQDSPDAVLRTLLQAGGGEPISRGAQISCFINSPKTSIWTLTSDDVIDNGPIEIINTTGFRDRKNRIIPYYREETHGWEIIAGEAVSAPIYVEEDDDEVRSVEITYPLVQSAKHAATLAAYDLLNSREFLQFTVTCKLRLLGVRVGDAMTVALPEVAAGNQKCIVVARAFDSSTFDVTLTLRSETDAKHAYALGQSQEAPPSPSLSGEYDPSNPPGPVDGLGFPSWTIIGNQVTKDGVTMPAIVIGGQLDPDPNVREIIVDYREFGAAEDAWTNHTTASVDATRFEITGLKSAQSYYAAISYRTVLGVQSARLILGPVTTADLSIDAGKIDFLEALGTASIAEFGEFVQEAAEAAQAAAESMSTIIGDVGLLGETSIEATLRDLNIKDRFDNLTHIDGVEVGTVVQNEINERIEGQEALVETFNLIGAKSGDNTAFIIDTDRVKVSPSETMAQRFSGLVAEAGENADAKILDERVVWSNAVSAQANATTLLSARVGDAEGAILFEQTARSDGDTALASTLSLLGAKNANGTAFVLDQNKVEVSPGQSFASTLTGLQADTASNQASITTLANTVTTANSALSTRIDTVTATANGHTSSISTLSSASSTYGARWGVTLNTNGHISGLLLNNGGQNKSSMTVVADSFVIASSAGGALTAPFAVSGSTVYMDNVVARNIGAGTITANQIVGGAVTAASATEGNPGLGGTQNFGFSSTGGKHVINASCTVSQTGSGVSGVQAILYRNGSEISRGAVAFAGPFSSTIPLLALDQPGAGSHNYSVVCNTTGGSTGTNAVSSIKIVVTELKR